MDDDDSDPMQRARPARLAARSRPSAQVTNALGVVASTSAGVPAMPALKLTMSI
jgi:hypothetical protein